ncbi:MAG: hypothetical protein L3J51_02265 [Cocleimonas sp.]|nr:hypothetical protein [Cocleimonas sp.]
MLNTRNKQPIKVGILEISAQNKALLEFFFNDTGKSYFKKVDSDQASCFIIDYDSPGAKESWEATFKKSQNPGIIISIKEIDLPSTIWVAKPLTIKALMNASLTIKEMIDNKNSVKEAVIAPIEKKQEKQQQEEIIAEIPQHENIPLKTVIDITEKDDIDVKNKIVEATVQKNIQENITTEYQVEDETLAENIVETIIEEKFELVVAGTNAAASSTSFAVSSDLVDVNHGLNTSNLFLDDGDTSSITPIDKTKIDNNSKNEDDIDSLLESLISEGETDNSSPADLDLAKSEIPKVNHNVVEVAPKTADLEDLYIDLKAVTTKLENSIQSSDELVIEVFDHTQSDNNTKPIDKLIDDVQADTNIISIPEKKSKLSKKSAEEELQSLLEEIRHEADDPSSISKSQKKTYLPTMADERWKLTCGKNKKKQNLQSLCTITPSEHILSSLLETIKQAKETKTVYRVKFKDIIVVIYPKTDSIYCNESIFSDYYANICHTPISKNDIKKHQLDESEIRLYRNKIEVRNENSHSMESFIWTTSLVTHQGHLPITTDINKTIGLKYWPNLTRLENVPHAIQISAIFHKCSKSLSEITNEMDIPKKYIIAFYNAALSLDFIQQDGKKRPSASTSVDSRPNKNRGFFSRLLQKLST